jgi:hypothetical protein
VSCLDENQVAALIAGGLPEPAAAAARDHLDGCDDCRALVAGALPKTAGSPRREPALPVPHRFGRYTVLRPLGAGGMGVVYLAEDPQLGRQVALKLLRPGAQGADEQARLLREARAMARLSHPNVIVVHDVGFADERVFVAMEYVDGGTLSSWLREKPRPVREIVRAFQAAGRGLSAAHAAGLVHRDFKPDNALVGSDGRVRVTDFGLARLETTQLRPASPAPDALASPLTVSGALVGSPAYMAPEQLRGEPTDARSDLFAFCVSLHEALYGVRPFAGGTVVELRQSIEEGRLRDPPPGARVPQWLRRALVRGLHADRRLRPASMDELLDELEQAPLRPWRAGVAAGALALFAAILVGLRPGAAAPECRGAGQQLVGIWDEQVREATRASFFATGAPFAADALASVRTALDAYASAWVAMRTESCEATQVRREQSQELFDLRNECLESRRRELKARTLLLAKADQDVVQRAHSLASSLPALQPCADARALRSQPKPPPAADVAKVASARARLADAQALRQAGKLAQAEQALLPLVTEADALGYRMLQAEVYIQAAYLETSLSRAKKSRADLEAAASAAVAAGATLLQAEAWTGLVAVDQWLGDMGGADLAEAQARAALERVGPTPELEGKLERHVSLLALRRDKRAEAEQHARRSLSLYEGLPHPDPSAIAHASQQLSYALYAREEGDGLPDARAVLERARTLVLGALGPEHPVTQECEWSLADLEVLAGRYSRARETYERILARRQAELPKQTPRLSGHKQVLGTIALRQHRFHDAEQIASAALSAYDPAEVGPRVAAARMMLGEALLAQGRLGEARENLGRALELDERTYGQNNSSSADGLIELGLVDLLEGKLPAARTRLRQALRRAEASLGPADRLLSRPLYLLGRVELADQRPAESLALCERALAAARRWRRAHPDLAWSSICVAQTQLALGRPRAALASLDEAQRALDALEMPAAVGEWVAGLRARARWDERHDEASLREVQRAARELAAAGEPLRSEGRELAGWAADHGQRAQR